MGSDSIFLEFKKAIVSSRLITSKARCRKPTASGLEGLCGGFGKENNSTTYEPFKAKSNLYDWRSSR
ncbi:hypothetical protein D3C80_1841520 [compost metagenome]